MNEYLVQAVAREQLNDRIAVAERTSMARRLTGRARRARHGAPARSVRAHHKLSVPASPFSRAGRQITNNVRHPVGAFQSWLAAGRL
jgi:hypothetical protein